MKKTLLIALGFCALTASAQRVSYADYVIAMVDEEYGIVLPPEEMRKTNTIQELFDLVSSKL